MAQLFLGVFKKVCGMPGSTFIGPFVLAINPISPINICAYLAWLLGLKYSKSKFVKTYVKSWKTAAAYAAGFYLCMAYILYFCILLAMCKAASYA